MGYIEDNLSRGETILYRAKVHWTIYVAGVLLTPVLIGLVLLLGAWIYAATTEMALTDRRVMMKKGLISRQTDELRLGKIETVKVDQGIFGRIFGVGSVSVIGTGGSKNTFKWIAAPTDFRNAVNRAIDASEAGTSSASAA
jgi:uncharacterized membrane protein YdbT with pleckstrin-like domain